MRRKADYTLMRCLYCGKELALLKRLTGGGEFCSEAHKQSYQEEYNRLALSRLLQAQKKADKTEAAGPLEKPEKEAKPERPAKSNKEQAPAPPQAPGLAHLEASAPQTPESEAPPPRGVPEPVMETVSASQPAAHPLEEVPPAGFLIEQPAVSACEDSAVSIDPAPQAALYLEPYPQTPSAPALIACAGPAPECDLNIAELVSLPAVTALASPAEAAVHDAPLAPREFEATSLSPSFRLDIDSRRQLPSAGVTPLEVAPRTLKFEANNGLAEPVSFTTVIQVENWPNWELPVPSADFPAEDADVVVGPWSGNGDHELWTDTVPRESADAALKELSAESEATPRMALEALSRLHQDLAQAETRQTGSAESVAAPVATLVAEPQEEETQEEQAKEAQHDALAPAADAEAGAADTPPPPPGHVTELLEIALKTFSPAKPGPMTSELHSMRPSALLPRLKLLPLRAKVALASGYAPQPEHSEPPPKPIAAAPRTPHVPPRTLGSKPVPVSLKTLPSKPMATAAARSKAPAAFAEPPKPEAAAKAVSTVPPAKTAERPAAAPSPNVKAVEEAPAKPAVPPQENPPERTATPAPPKADSAPKLPARLPPQDDLLPSFSSVQPGTSFLGSLKLKLGLGIVLIAGACTAYLGWGTKPHKLAPVSDGAGPSIIMGEGGWVEGWGGDPSNVHAGRQITVYRPSLQLADYRIEFQGMIETKSLGWVFRAADPQNYYAMKLMLVPSGSTPKLDLFKYLVVNGRQTQVGRLPVDLPVHPDTYFNVRVDVRGPQFTTYLQGQQVDVWTDDQLKTGGVGLLNEREERGQVKLVSIRILNGVGK